MSEIAIPAEEYVATSSLKVDGKNPNKLNKKGMERLKKSITKFGFIVPIITNKDLLIADGEQRWNAAKELGMPKVKVIRLPVAEVDRHLIRQVMNKLRGEHDELLDAEEFKSIIEDGGEEDLKFLLNLTDSGLDNYMKKLGDEEADGFQAPDLTDVETTITVGDIIQLGAHRLMCGDSTNSEHVAALLNGATPIAMVTDPPYGVEYDPTWRNPHNMKSKFHLPAVAVGKVNNDDTIDWKKAFELFPGDVAYVWHAGKYAAAFSDSLTAAGFIMVSQIIWAKPSIVFSRGDYHWKHEPCWYAVRKGRKHNWQGSRTENTVWEIAGMNPMGRSSDKDDARTGHGTQKPLECMKRPILNNTAKNEGVYDPFLGSGTTLIAAEQTTRTCYAMELNPAYCEISARRWEQLTGKKRELIKNSKTGETPP